MPFYHCKVPNPHARRIGFDWASSGNDYPEVASGERACLIGRSRDQHNCGRLVQEHGLVITRVLVCLAQDVPLWNRMSSVSADWASNIKRGDDFGHTRAHACIRDRYAPILLNAKWYSNFRVSELHCNLQCGLSVSLDTAENAQCLPRRMTQGKVAGTLQVGLRTVLAFSSPRRDPPPGCLHARAH